MRLRLVLRKQNQSSSNPFLEHQVMSSLLTRALPLNNALGWSKVDLLFLCGINTRL